MRSVRLLALAALALASLAYAQDAFPDVPANHWAYAALARMKAEGLLVGYPDGLYRGGRPASRYELAVAMHAAYLKLKETTDGLATQIKALQGAANTSDFAALKDAVATLQAQLAAMRRYGADLVDLQRASDAFELELTQLGIDAQAMKDELRGLATRVGALERKKDPLRIGGRIDLWAGGGHGDGDRFGLNRDGRIEGTNARGPIQDSAFGTTRVDSIPHNAVVLHEAAFDFATANDAGVKVRGTVVATNAFGDDPFEGGPTSHIGFGNQSDLFSPANTFQAGSSPNRFGYAEATGDLYVQTLALGYAGRGYDLEAGRVQHQATPWIFRRIDNTSYFSNPRWDSGDYTFDGATARTRLGPVGVEAYGGTNHAQTANGILLDPIRSGPVGGFTGLFDLSTQLLADRFVGGTATASLGPVGLRGDALFLKADNDAVGFQGVFDELRVYGGEADVQRGRLRLSGGLRQSEAYAGGGHVEGLAGNAWNARLSYASRRLDLSAEYRQVQTDYLAPGDWGRLGVLRNPTNVRGGIAKARVGLIPRLDLGLEGEISHGLDRAPFGNFFDRGTDIGRYAAHLDARLGAGWNGGVYYEQTVFNDLAVGAPYAGTPRYQWYGVSLGRDLAANARFTLAYEQSAIRDDFQTSDGQSYRGGFLTTQVTVRF